jgi:hypothetical protein
MKRQKKEGPQKEAPKKSVWRSVWLWILVVILLLGGAYAVLSYGLPYAQLKYGMWRMERLYHAYPRLKQECPEGDAACGERKTEDWNKMNVDFGKALGFQSPMREVRKRQDLIEAMKHLDGTVCYVVETPVREVTDDELHLWLQRFGMKRFEEMMPYFLRARGVFEKRYHGAHPTDVEIAELGKLKWHYVPFGTTWRLYNTAERMLGWSKRLEKQDERPPIPDEALAEILPLLRQQGEYFTWNNLFRMLDMVHVELHPELYPELVKKKAAQGAK